MKEVLSTALVIFGYLFGTLYSFYKVAKALILTTKCNVEVEGTLVSVEKTSYKGRHGRIHYIYVPIFKYLYGRHWYTAKSGVEFWYNEKPHYIIGGKSKIYISNEDPKLCVHSKLFGSNGCDDMISLVIPYVVLLLILISCGAYLMPFIVARWF